MLNLFKAKNFNFLENFSKFPESLLIFLIIFIYSFVTILLLNGVHVIEYYSTAIIFSLFKITFRRPSRNICFYV